MLQPSKQSEDFARLDHNDQQLLELMLDTNGIVLRELQHQASVTNERILVTAQAT